MNNIEIISTVPFNNILFVTVLHSNILQPTVIQCVCDFGAQVYNTVIQCSVQADYSACNIRRVLIKTRIGRIIMRFCTRHRFKIVISAFMSLTTDATARYNTGTLCCSFRNHFAFEHSIRIILVIRVRQVCTINILPCF